MTAGRFITKMYAMTADGVGQQILRAGCTPRLRKQKRI